jgi:hypothetical protein
MNMAATGGSHGWAMLGLVALAPPFVVPFLKHPQAGYLNATLLAFLVLTPLKTWWDFNQGFGKLAKAAGGLPEGAFKEMSEVISIGAGTYILIAASLVLAVQAFKNSTRRV